MGLHDHTSGHVVLVVGRDRSPHDLDQLGREQRVLRRVIDPVRLVTADPDVNETRSLELLGEDTLRQGTRHSAGPRALVVGHLRRQLALDGEIGERDPSAGPEDAEDLGEGAALPRGQVQDAV